MDEVWVGDWGRCGLLYVVAVWLLCGGLVVRLSRNSLRAGGGGATAGALRHLTSLTSLGFVCVQWLCVKGGVCDRWWVGMCVGRRAAGMCCHCGELECVCDGDVCEWRVCV